MPCPLQSRVITHGEDNPRLAGFIANMRAEAVMRHERGCCYRLVNGGLVPRLRRTIIHAWFRNGIMTSVVGTSICVCVEVGRQLSCSSTSGGGAMATIGGEGRGGEGEASYDVLNAAQITFTGVFVVEMCVKLLAVGIGGYV